MITAIIHITTAADSIPEVARAAVDLDGITEVFSVTGDVDLIAIARVAAHEDLAGVVADKLSKIPGVKQTSTYIAFQAYAKADLEAGFSLGY